jgi:N-acetylglutamate synthase-like GNAT family acetyltransferase
MIDWIEDIVKQIHELSAASKPIGNARKWLRADGIELYVRLGVRLVPDSALRCLDIANIEIAESKQKQGRFSDLLNRLEHEVPGLGLQAIVVENIIPRHLWDYLYRRGYRPSGQDKTTLYKESPDARA